MMRVFNFVFLSLIVVSAFQSTSYAMGRKHAKSANRPAVLPNVDCVFYEGKAKEKRHVGPVYSIQDGKPVTDASARTLHLAVTKETTSDTIMGEIKVRRNPDWTLDELRALSMFGQEDIQLSSLLSKGPSRDTGDEALLAEQKKNPVALVYNVAAELGQKEILLKVDISIDAFGHLISGEVDEKDAVVKFSEKNLGKMKTWKEMGLAVRCSGAFHRNWEEDRK